MNAAANISNLAFLHAQHMATCRDDAALVRYHRSEVVAWARYLVAGLTKLAAVSA